MRRLGKESGGTCARGHSCWVGRRAWKSLLMVMTVVLIGKDDGGRDDDDGCSCTVVLEL